MNSANLLATIADLKAELQRIDLMKQKIESTISTLVALANQPFIAGVEEPDVVKPVLRRRTKFPSSPDSPSISTEEPIPSDRVHAALNRMDGRFKRGDLRDNALNDGKGGPIAEGTFANIFIKLLKRKQIVCIEGTVGQRDAVFMKAEEAKEALGILDLPFGEPPK